MIAASYLVAATLFLLGLQRMASPKTARSGIQWAGAGMVIATLATFFVPGLGNIGLMIAAIALGTVLAWVSGKRVAITDMPQMVALYNGLGGGSAAAIGAVELLRWNVQVGVADAAPVPLLVRTLAVLGALIGAIALTGLAVAFEGYVLGNEALIIAGTMVGAAGMLLTRLMAKAMNRSIRSVLFSSFGASGEASAIEGAQVAIEAGDVAAMMAYAERVVIVPGYGMAVAQAQHKIWELAQRLMERGVKVKFAIHPVAGRMPGHMNVLLAEAGVPYDLIADMDDINPEFATTDVSLVIGANDVVNPVAKTDPASPIYGMPILDVVDSRHTIVIKRGAGTGFAGIENALFYAPNTRMLYGDGAAMAGALVSELKALDGGH